MLRHCAQSDEFPSESRSVVLCSTVKLNLEGYNLKNLRYLQHGDTRQDEAEDAVRFQAWKACLGRYLPILLQNL